MSPAHIKEQKPAANLPLPDDIAGWPMFRSLSLEDPNGPHPDGYGRTLCISRSSIRAPIVRERYAAPPGACRSVGSWIAPSLTATGSARLQVRTSDAGCSQIGLGSSRPFRRRYLPNVPAASVEVVDVSLRIGYRGIGIGPREADLKRGKQHTVDDDRLQIRSPDPGVPQTFSGLEGFDLKAVIVHLRDSGHFPKPTETCADKNECEPIHMLALFFAPEMTKPCRLAQSPRGNVVGERSGVVAHSGQE